MVVTKTIKIVMVEQADLESFGLEVQVDEGISTLEAIAMLEVAKIQHLQSKHEQGPTVYQTPEP